MEEEESGYGFRWSVFSCKRRREKLPRGEALASLWDGVVQIIEQTELLAAANNTHAKNIEIIVKYYTNKLN